MTPAADTGRDASFGAVPDAGHVTLFFDAGRVLRPASSASAISLERLCVRARRIEANVHVGDRFHRTTPELARRALAVFPTLAAHPCVNDEGPVFGSVIARTSLPHLLEHLVIDLQVRAEGDALSGALRGAASGFTYVGTTQWLDEEQGLARVEVSFADDLVALRAFRDAARFLNAAVLP